MSPFALVVVLLWAAALYFGTSESWRLSPKCTYSRALPARHRLVSGDVACGEPSGAAPFLGRYLRAPVEAHAAARDSELTDVPEAAAGAGQAMVWLDLAGRQALAGELNAGSVVDLAGGPAALVTDATVAAIVCKDRTTTACTAAIAVPAASQSAVAAQAANLMIFVKRK